MLMSISSEITVCFVAVDMDKNYIGKNHKILLAFAIPELYKKKNLIHNIIQYTWIHSQKDIKVQNIGTIEALANSQLARKHLYW